MCTTIYYGIVVIFLYSLFPLLQLYDKHVNMSIIGYFGAVRTIKLHRNKLPASFSGSHDEIEQATKTYPDWVRSTIQLLKKYVLIKTFYFIL